VKPSKERLGFHQYNSALAAALSQTDDLEAAFLATF
jgi:hypothetical protein